MFRTKDILRLNVKDMLEVFDSTYELEKDRVPCPTAFFTIDGSTSEYKYHEDDEVIVEINNLYVTLSCKDNTIKIPNMCRSTLPSMIKRAAEILLFEKGVKVEY